MNINIIIIFGLILFSLIVYILRISKDKISKPLSSLRKYEIPPNFVKTPVFLDEILKPETEKERQEYFNKAYVSYKIKNKEKFNYLSELEAINEKKLSENRIEQQKKIDAMLLVSEQENNKNDRLKKLGHSLKKLAMMTGNDEL